MDQYYTAAEAAAILGLEYHTFMARARRGVYLHEHFGRAKVFHKQYIEQLKMGGTNAPNTFAMEEAAR